MGIFGVPERIRSDGGTQFTAKVVQELNQLLKLSQKVIVPYYPEANGIVERSNAEIIKHLRSLVLSRRVMDQWSTYLPLVQRILNFTKHGSLTVSPHTIIFGDMIPDVMVDRIVSYEQALVDEYLYELKKVQVDLVKSNQLYLEEQAKKRDHRLVSVTNSTGTPPFKVGDYVLLSYPNGPPSKLSSLYRGPMKIKGMKTPYIFFVVDLLNNREYEVHANRLRVLKLAENITEDDLKELALADSQEFEVDQIVDHKGKPTSKVKMKFLVKWKHDEELTWEPYDTVKDLEALELYIQDHPELKVL
jgi:hypothetical protein